jgi:hypothetical protein
MMAVRCQLCGKLSPERSIRCDCGYDFRTGEMTAAIEGAECELEVAQRRIGRGIAALVAIPVALAIGGLLIYSFDALAALIVLVLAPCLLAVAGAVGLVGGIRGSMTASRRLRQAKVRKELPAARVVE